MFHTRSFRPRRLSRTTVMVGVVVLTFTMGGAAIAAIPNSSTGVITGCYQTIVGNLRVIDAQAGQRCNLFERQLSWNQAGVPGPKGDPGAVGPQGAAGPAGPAGEPGSSTGDEVFFAHDRFFATREQPFTLSESLPAGSYVVKAEITAATSNGVGGVTTAATCELPTTQGPNAGVAKLMTFAPDVLDPGSVDQIAEHMVLTSALDHAGGEITLECFAGNGSGVAVSATLLATKVSSVG